jgi:soluble lytic murein transglycosylase-like protein
MKWRPRQQYNSQAFSKHLLAYTYGMAGIVLIGVILTAPKPATASDATALVTAAAKRHRVPVDLALRVGRAESGLQCHRHNKSGASGPLQIMPSTARAMGYRGPSIRRASCAVQTEWGMRHLAMCYRGAKGDRRIAAACHYQGVSALQRVSRAGAAYARRVVR